MKKIYIDPELKIVKLNPSDVLTLSNTTDGVDDWGESPIW